MHPPARARARRQGGRLLLTMSAIALGATACNAAAARPPGSSGPLAAQTRAPAAATSLLTGAGGALSAKIAAQLFTSAPVVVVANARSQAAVSTGGTDAERVHAPLLLTSGLAGQKARPLSSPVRSELIALHPSDVLAVGVTAQALSAQLHGISVVTAVSALPKTTAPAPLSSVVLLTREGEASPKVSAAIATSQVAGVRVIPVHGYDPRADPAAISALSTVKPKQVLAVGARFGPPVRLARRVAVAVTGVQLPGGGQVLFPAHRLVAMYGHPGAPALGALGEQDLPASIARVRRFAALYQPLSKVPVIPTFEIIASVAQGSSNGGTYSYLTPVADIRPWVTRAEKAGLYVVLDLQPGRANFLTQAKFYRRLLKLPDVGLALDPEWKLGPHQLPLKQIGSVSITEVNSVVNWLAALTQRYHLPQKLLVLHQFRLSMIRDEQDLNTRHDDLAIVIHMDGQGTPSEKEQTWDAVLGAAPHGVHFGWKDFLVKDHPMLTPSQTMARSPQPVMISYQ
jgi:hypothetical protein